MFRIALRSSCRTFTRSVISATATSPVFPKRSNVNLFPSVRTMTGVSRDGNAYSSKEAGGEFKRQTSSFRNTISEDGEFKPEKGRYHLVVSYACPWAHRTLITRKLKGLEDIISVSVVHPFKGDDGWSFTGEGYGGQGEPKGGIPYTTPKDTLYNVKKIRDLYFKAEPDYDMRFTVPVLWDLKNETIVNNESAEIIRIFYTAFDSLIEDKYKGVTYYPEEFAKEIDEFNSWVYDQVNNGVYKAGFATTQEAYEKNFYPLLDALKRLNELLKGKDYVFGDRLTEADIRLYPTIVRYDPVYTGHFKCTQSIRHNYPELNRWMKNLYWKNPAFKDTTNFDHIKIHYYSSHTQINPTGIVPVGPIPAIEEL